MGIEKEFENSWVCSDCNRVIMRDGFCDACEEITHENFKERE